MNETNKHPVRTVLFWIFFPLITLIITALLLFYLDLANGPMILMIVECIAIVILVAIRILIRKKRFLIRMIPFLALVATNIIIIPLAKPTVESYYAVSSKAEATEVMKLANGDVKGVFNKDKTVKVYAGIPYAKAPVEELRWKEPQDVENWYGVKDCSKFAARAMQVDNNSVIDGLVEIYGQKMYVPDFKMEPRQNMSEDCLYLNIWRPNNNKTDLPILVYIHGGSLTGGTGADKVFNGEEMAKLDVIFISIQYRLGVFGYFAHPELQEESPNHTTGNYGLLDQIKALEWINKNASYFGGDAGNITIAGESAGSSSVSAICSSPLAKGLFKRAIGESSSLVVKQAPHTYRKLEDALQMGKDIMEEYKCKNIAELRNIDVNRLINTKYTNSSMTLDGYALTKNPYDVYKDGENNEEALLNGYNVLEGDAFVIPQFLFSPTNKGNIEERLATIFGETYAKKWCELYKEEIEKDAFSVMNKIFSNYWFLQPHYSWSNMALANGVDVYSYQFTKENHYRGTYHAGEIIYAYGNVKNDPKTYRFNESDIALSNTMLNYWANFAKTGNPNGEGLVNWPKYNSEDKKLFELGERIGEKDDENLAAFALIDEYLDYLLK